MLMVGSSKFVTVNFDCKEGSGHLHLHTRDFMMSVFLHGRKGFAVLKIGSGDWSTEGLFPNLMYFDSSLIAPL